MRDSSGRLIIPTDSVDGRRSEAWRALVVAVCVCPPSLRERVERAARKVSTTGPAHAVHTAVGSRSSALKAQVGCAAAGVYAGDYAVVQRSDGGNDRLLCVR